MPTYILAIIITIIIFILILIIFNLFNSVFNRNEAFSIDNNVLYSSSIDGKKYYVQGGHDNVKEAANVFAKVNTDVTKFLTNLYNKYKNSSNAKRKEVSTLMYKRFNTESLRESSPLNPENDTSFTINKGDVIAICIRDSYSYGIQDYNIIMFVVLHELTHLAIEAYDHPDEFWLVFKFVLLEASAANLYKPVDYVAYPVEYCGIVVNYSPLYDNTLVLI